MKENLIKDKSFAFSLKAIQVYKLLIAKNEYVLSRQFLRSSTSIGANVNEVSAGYSKKDFTAKMSIASKEARETLYWIELLEQSNFIVYDFSELKSECESIVKILTAIVKTAQSNIKKQ